MCGVVASVGRGSFDRVEGGLAKIAHRGVRSTVVGGADWSIGHVRLPIVGVSPSHDQPVESGPWTIGWVGEILGFRESNPGMECDTDLVVRAWVDRGPDGFRDFDGFWSVVARDSRDGSVRCLVDYLSQKPLYVRDDRWATAVGSEPDAVAGMGPTDLDWTYLSAVVKWGYCPETWRTPYVGITRMRPGEEAVLRPGGGVHWRVVDPLIPASSSTSDLRSEVESAVRRRVESSDVPVACLVSGGLDSSIVWTLAGRYGSVRGYHVENGEGDAARSVAPGSTVLGAESVDPEKGFSYMQEPLDLGSLLPQVALSDGISKIGGESVCLTGDGADEMFGGYGRSARYDSQYSDVFHELVGWHLPRLDRIMMRNRIEVRTPFLARRVARIALGLPYRDRIDKKVLRDLFRDDLPTGVADRPKRPLRTPDVEDDREGRSRSLVEMLVDRHRLLQEGF